MHIMETEEHYILGVKATRKEWTELRDIFQYFLDKDIHQEYPKRPTSVDLIAWRNVCERIVNSDQYTRCDCNDEDNKKDKKTCKHNTHTITYSSDEGTINLTCKICGNTKQIHW